MDQSSMNPRKNLAATVADNYPNNGGWVMHGSSSSSVAVTTGNGVGLFGSRPPPPPPLFSSLPSFSVTPPLSHQPPLLPLPFSKSATLPSPSKRVTAASATDVRPRQHKQKSRPSAGSRKETRTPGTARSEPKPVDKTQEEEGNGEEFLGTSLYSISPPPSSLPIPRFSLTRPKGVSESTTASCNVQAAGGAKGGGGVGAVDAGASDNLRQLLRL